MGTTLALLNAVTSWQLNLRPASFRAVPFYTEGTEGAGGRRLVVHEFPLRDDAFLEDLGRRPQRHQVNAIVLGGDYMDQRDALISACQDFDDAATLVHPYLGELQCRAGLIRWRESQEFGGCAIFQIEFVVDPGGLPCPLAGTDTASSLLTGLVSMLRTIKSAYILGSLIVQDPAFLLSFSGGLLAGAAGAFLGLPAATVSLLGNLAAAIATTPLNTGGTADAVAAAYGACVDAVVQSQTVPPQPDDPVAGTPPRFAPPSDLTGGLAALASWGSDLPVPPGVGAVQAAQAQQQAAIVALVQGTALASVLQVYAQLDWASAAQAAAAQGQVMGLLSAQADAAAAAGQDDLYRGWLAITGMVVDDFAQRIQALPVQTAYALPLPMPSLALAQLFYQDATRAPELEAMNDVAHPLFMPATGIRLAA